MPVVFRYLAYSGNALVCLASSKEDVQARARDLLELHPASRSPRSSNSLYLRSGKQERSVHERRLDTTGAVPRSRVTLLTAANTDDWQPPNPASRKISLTRSVRMSMAAPATTAVGYETVREGGGEPAKKSVGPAEGFAPA